ncbi:hypothetical protein GMB86_10890 [Terrilactibacillus sp. BCM23-1]|uniref:Uncharacterized protein n=1 Tax=Terrilactibacillus tamarindi TaxID=2599694 RepID=A0A6N8CQS9_9BACI|nr:hypothetical protein [Terrilactibacillus tamarindi]MTT32512.1 hypothetical protein [Terrilactibacillus tamarindi]
MEIAMFIIFAVISLVGYVARSVDKQNKEQRQRMEKQKRIKERQNRQRQRYDSTYESQTTRDAGDKPVTTISSETAPQQEQPAMTVVMEEHSSGQALLEQYEKMKQKNLRERPIGSLKGLSVKQSRRVRSDRPFVMNQKKFAESFILAECIAKPRAYRPHKALRKS